jgi:MORN repeat
MPTPQDEASLDSPFQPIWRLTPGGTAVRITGKADLLATVLSGVIEPSTRVRADHAQDWTSAADNPAIAPLLAYPTRLKRSRWLFLALSAVLGAAMIIPLFAAGYHGWRTMVSFAFIVGVLRGSYVAAVGAIELGPARQLLLYVSGVALAVLGFGVCDAAIELARLALFPELAPDSDWLAIPLFVGVVLIGVAMSVLLWERWSLDRLEVLRPIAPSGHPPKARTAQLLAKQARVRGLLGVEGCGRQASPEGDRYEGKFDKKRRDGHGVYTWASGVRYEGEWRKGQRHGFGVSVAADGSETAGQWRNGERVTESS